MAESALLLPQYSLRTHETCHEEEVVVITETIFRCFRDKNLLDQSVKIV